MDIEKGNKEIETDWAFSEKLQINIHISQAESGLKGYRCLGCDAQMIANIQKKDPTRKSFFRHHATNIDKVKPECVKANRKYREKIAREIINRLKYVNAPALYIMPPNMDDNFLPMLVSEKKMIVAKYTKAELSFYEDENGIINWGSNPDILDKKLLVRPDVTFFDNNDKPILFIEFIVTNKISSDKYIKLSRLSIDTLKINIPSKSELEIEKALKSSKNYKWVYNEKAENTTYIPVSRTCSESLSKINENERIIFKESFKCRQSEINELIRSIRKCLQSEQYRGVELNLNKQIQEVEKNSEREKQELDNLEELHRREALTRNSEEEDKENNQYRNLETRYLAKDEALRKKLNTEQSNNSIKIHVESSIKRERGEIRNITKLTRKIHEERPSIEARIEEEIWDSIREEIEFEESEIKRITNEIKFLERNLRATIESDIIEFRRKIKLLEEEEKEIEDKIFREFEEQIIFEESEIRRISNEEKRFQIDVRNEFDREVEEDTSKLTKKLRNLLEARRFLSIYTDSERKETLYRKARKFFKQGTWKER